MKIVPVLVLFIFFTGHVQAQRSLKKQDSIPGVFSRLEQMPVFPGGPEAMQKYLADNINFPKTMRSACTSQKMVVGFVVKEDGSITRIDFLKSVEGCPDFEYEVIRVVKAMPKWIPGKLKNQPVKCLYQMPVYID